MGEVGQVPENQPRERREVVSGGALDYLYARVNDAADRIETYRYTEYLALANHLRRIANVLYDVEWVMSGDKTSPDDIEAIRTIITPSEILDVAIQRAVSAKQDLDRAIEIAQRARMKCR